MRRYLETLFRYRKLFLIPVLAIPIVAIVTTLYAGRQYTVSASVWVAPSPAVEAASRTTKVLANQLEAQAIRERLGTETFRREVMERISLTAAIMQGQWPVPTRLQASMRATGLSQLPGMSMLGLSTPNNWEEALGYGSQMLKSSITATASGNNLVRITYKGKEPLLGQRLVEETMVLHTQKTMEAKTGEARASLEFYSQQLQTQAQRVNQANLAVQQYTQTHPVGPGATRPAAQEQELEVLRRNLAVEQTLYDNTLAKLQGQSATSAPGNYLQTVDEAHITSSGSISLATLLKAAIGGGLIGVFVGLLPILAMAWSDNKVRGRRELTAVLQPAFIAEVPLIPAGPRDPRGFLSQALIQRAAEEAH